MDIERILYKIKTAKDQDINLHLLECDDNFVPPLSQRIVIADYSTKLFNKSITFEAWSEQKLIGLIATYFDRGFSSSAFITNVSVNKAYGSRGIASSLLAMCIDYARRNDTKELKLEVNVKNFQAISFYKKFAFVIEKNRNTIVKMKLKLTHEVS